jgi:hypothetical protein
MISQSSKPVAPCGERSRTRFAFRGFRYTRVAGSHQEDADGKSTFMISLAKDIRRVTSADGGIALDVRRGTMFRLNPLGARVLDLLERGESLSRIADLISAEFGAALDVVQADLREFLDALELHGVLDRRGPEA